MPFITKLFGSIMPNANNFVLVWLPPKTEILYYTVCSKLWYLVAIVESFLCRADTHFLITHYVIRLTGDVCNKSSLVPIVGLVFKTLILFSRRLKTLQIMLSRSLVWWNGGWEVLFWFDLAKQKRLNVLVLDRAGTKREVLKYIHQGCTGMPFF